LNVDTQLLKRTMFDATCSGVSSASSRTSQRIHALNYKEKLRPEIKICRQVLMHSAVHSPPLSDCVDRFLEKITYNKCHVISTGENAGGQTWRR